MKVRANLNLSMNQGGDGLNPAVFICGEVYDIPEEVYKDNEDHFTLLDQAEEPPKADEEAADVTSVADLVEDNSRRELNEMAEALGLDPADYRNKTEIAEAIVEAKAK